MLFITDTLSFWLIFNNLLLINFSKLLSFIFLILLNVDGAIQYSLIILEILFQLSKSLDFKNVICLFVSFEYFLLLIMSWGSSNADLSLSILWKSIVLHSVLFIFLLSRSWFVAISLFWIKFLISSVDWALVSWKMS